MAEIRYNKDGSSYYHNYTSSNPADAPGFKPTVKTYAATGAPVLDSKGSTIPVVSATNIGETSTPKLPTPAASGVGNEQIALLTAQLKGLESNLKDAQELGYKENEQINMEGGNVISKSKKALNDLLGNMTKVPNTEDIYLKAEQDAGLQQKRQLVNTLSGQLSAIVAKAQADNLKLENTGAAEGVTDVVYSAQKSRVNNDAAIQSLPIAAQLAVAQGDLQLAQQHVDTLFKIRSQDAQNKFEYGLKTSEALFNFASDEDKRRLGLKDKDDDRAYQEKRDAIATANQFAQSLLKTDPRAAARLMGLSHDAKDYSAQVASIVSRAQTTIPTTTGGSTSTLGVSLTADDKRNLLGAGFTPTEAQQVQNDVNQYGVAPVLEGITDPTQRKAIENVYGIQAKVTREQVSSTVTQKVAQDGLKDTYTDEELSKLARDNGFAAFFTGKVGEVENFLASDKAKELYVNLLYKQYVDAGMAQ